MGFGVANDLVEGAVHDVEEPLVDFAFAPEEALAVLNPFEVTDGDATGIAENIGHGENALGIDDGVGLPGGGAICAFAKDFGLNLVGVLFSDLIFDGGGDDHIARLEQNVASAHLGATTVKFLKRFLLGVDPIDDFGNVETLLVVKTTTDISEADDAIAGFLHEFGGEGTNVAETLNADAGGFFFHTELGEGFVDANHDAAASGFATAT